jgi:hypothetical protein
MDNTLIYELFEIVRVLVAGHFETITVSAAGRYFEFIIIFNF